MPLCNVCEKVPDIQAGKFKDLPWEETPCGKCHWTGNVQHNKGVTHISFELLIANCHEKDITMEDADATDEATTEPAGDGVDLPDPENDGVLPDTPDHDILVTQENEVMIPSLAGLSRKRSQAFMDFFSEWLRLTPLKRDIIAKRISEPTITNKEIADSLGVTDQHVGFTLNEIMTSGKLVTVGSVRLKRNRTRKTATQAEAAG